MNAQNSPGAVITDHIPIVLGVTGHRDLREGDIPRLKEQVGKLIEELQHAYPATPLLVLSPLAEGADRLVAEVGLTCGARLVVPLPLPRQEYERDFETASSRKQFTDLLTKAEAWFPLPLTDGNTPDNVRENGERRNQQYAAVGTYIARHCHVLLALWDGDTTEKTGGTSQIVRLRHEGFRPPASLYDSTIGCLDSGPVYHIVTPHVERPEPIGKPFVCHKLFPDDQHYALSSDGHRKQKRLAESFAALWRHIDQFNQDAVRFGPQLAASIQKSRSYLFPDASMPGLDHGLRRLRADYALADTLALHFQVRRRNCWRMLCVLGVVAVVFLSAGALATADAARVFVLIAYFVVVGGATLLVRQGEGRKRAGITSYRRRHLDYRALAEGMRVQFFWRLAELEEEVADHYLRKQRSELEWIRQAIRAWNLPVEKEARTKSSIPSAAQRHEWVQKHWIEDQARYFLEAQRRNAANRNGLGTFGKYFLWAGLVLVFLLLVQQVWLLCGGKAEGHIPYDVGIAFATVTVAVFGAAEVYAEKMALSQEAKQYDLMDRLFNRAANEFQQALVAGDQARLPQIARELGHEALLENGDWVLLHRERPMEVRFG